ncbi:tetratricopeptide repeat protein [Cruoricaptor ignavus]|uniref:tetratricopeptide repeat protein n=1 Tax=Cruoricaptor ignavus TaxID=1118202 RepID=UPI00370D6F89
MRNRTLSIGAAVLFFSLSGAQQTKYFTQASDYHFGLAENLFQGKVYNASQYEFASEYFYGDLNNSQKEAARFFDNLIGTLLQKDGAELGLQAFLEENPNSAFLSAASLPLADYYLNKKDYERALEMLMKVNQLQLSREENSQYVLKLGYAKFMTGDKAGAVEALHEAYNSAEGESRKEISYMLGHLSYSGGDSEAAFKYFDEIKDDEKFAGMVKPYYVQMYYNTGDYSRAISEGKNLLDGDLSPTYKSEVQKIIGESYFRQGKYSDAYPYLKNYLEQQQNPTSSDLYEMGFLAAKMQNYEEAVHYYNRLLNEQSASAQNAYYQLGNAYLQTGRKQEALSAFRSAYQMSYDAKVKQLAHEQYAKLGYELGNPFETPGKVLQAYISAYPKSAKRAEMQKLLVNSYLYSGDYRATLEAIDKMGNASGETEKINQEVSLLLGMEEFNKGNYDEAEKYLNRSLKKNISDEAGYRARYWLAQIDYQKGRYPAAISGFEKLAGKNFPENQQVPYDLGYAYFKSKNFPKAQQNFSQYLKNPQEEYKADAELRLADTYFAENKLTDAIALYDKAEGADEHTMFQKAMAQGYRGDSQAKISELKKFTGKYPNSEFAEQANFEIAAAYASQEDYSNSNAYLEKVIKSGKDRDLTINARIARAQNLADLGQTERALQEFRLLGSEYRNTEWAKKILPASRAAFLKNNDISGYQAFAKSLGVDVSSAELDEINLTGARNFYQKKEYARAIPMYEKFLIKNPTGQGRYLAQYELGESYYQTKNAAKALAVLQEVANEPNDYQTEAQTRIAQIYLAQNNSAEAIRQLEKLLKAPDKKIRNFANVELMSLYAENNEISKASQRAEEVLKDASSPPPVLEKARVIRARSLMQTGKDRDAQNAYAALEKSTNPEVAAEALYAKAFYQNKAKAYKNSNETIFKLANNFASEEYWGAKALLVMARNYLGLQDQYQASYTVDQVIANYQDFPEIISEAKEIKKSIKK